MPSSLSILPYYFSIGDHRCFIVDFLMEYFIREGTIPIVQSEMRWLTISQLKVIENYITSAEASFKYHKINEKLE